MLGKRGRHNQYTLAKAENRPVPSISEEARRRISENSKKQVWSEERRSKHSEIMKRAVERNPESYTSANRGRTKQIIYKGIKFQGQWELGFYRWAESQGLNPQRNTESFEYIWKGTRRYFPDFYIPSLDLYIEVKGYATERDQAKWLQFPKKLRIITEIDIRGIRKGTFTGL